MQEACSGREVLRQLIDARLLTSYEVREADEAPTRRVEIIHESLLANWPRLVRWQTQDADAAQLRDQLRQAARTWHEHDRSDDLLWSGSAYREYAVWRERYPGGLTELEEAFAAAMTSLATRRRRRRRIAVAAALVVAVAVAAVFGALWRRSVQETRRAEAAKLLALAQARLADDPTEALALTTASLEVADTREAREFVMRALWTAPPALELEVDTESQLRFLSFSPDGRHIAVAGLVPEVRVWSEDGQGPIRLGGHSDQRSAESTSRCGRRTTCSSPAEVAGCRVPGFGDRVQLWSIPEGKLLRVVDFGSPGYWQVGLGRLFARIEHGEGAERRIELRSWKLPDGRRSCSAVSARARLRDSLSGADRALGPVILASRTSSPRRTARAGWWRGAARCPSARSAGEGRRGCSRCWRRRRPWRPSGSAASSSWTRPATPGCGRLAVESPAGSGRSAVLPAPRAPCRTRQGRRLASLGPTRQSIQVWELAGLPGASPLELRRSGSWYDPGFAFHPAGDWCVATTHVEKRLTFWPLARPYPSVVEGYDFPRLPQGARLQPGQPLARDRLGGGRPAAAGGGGRPLRRARASPAGASLCSDLRFDPEGRFLLVVTMGEAWVVPLDGEPSRG